MGATSATGVSGVGSAAKAGAGMKGSESTSMAVHKLIGPRVVMAGRASLPGGGSTTIYFPTLPGTASDYTPFFSTDGATAVKWGSFSVSSVAVTGAASATVGWQIVKNGLWGSPVTDLGDS